MKKTLAVLLLALPLAAQDYRFDEVKRTVELNQARASRVTPAKGGDAVETGWFSYALIAAEGQRAKFEIFSATEVRLADGTPGVLLSVERGRIRAIFDKITGGEPRVVKTPGALLAVRGTKFDVQVDANGDTVVDVLEGVVEVQSPLLSEPMFVRPGQSTTYGRRRPPVTEPTSERRHRGDGRIQGGGHDGGGMTPGGRSGDPRGGGMMPPPAQPPSQPRTGGHHKPPV